MDFTHIHLTYICENIYISMHFQQEPVELTYTYKGKISNLKLFNKILYARQRYFFPLDCKILLEVLKNWLRYRCWHGDVFCRFEPYAHCFTTPHKLPFPFFSTTANNLFASWAQRYHTVIIILII